MLSRILEPEVMDSVEEARDYDSMDHSEVNRRFVDHLLEFSKTDVRDSVTSAQTTWTVLDVGTGTAQIPIELAQRDRRIQITAIDLANHMLELGQENVIRANLSDRIHLRLIDAKELPFSNAGFHWVISNSIIHHIPEPLTALGEMLRVLEPGGVLFVRDLLRPTDRSTLNNLVRLYAGESNQHQQQMFADSLHAALSLAEVQDMLMDLGYPSDWAIQTTDRHWTIAGRKAT